MKIYAQLNENKICIGISQLSGEVIQENMIEIPVFSDSYMWKKYENSQWSVEKFEPISTAPISEFEMIKEKQVLMENAIAELIMGGM